MMKLTKPQLLILFCLGEFYRSLNQPLEKTPLELATSKITFIELLLKSNLLSKQERALYENLEKLEHKQLLRYKKRNLVFTEKGLKELKKINQEVQKYISVKEYFHSIQKPQRKLQTVIKNK